MIQLEGGRGNNTGDSSKNNDGIDEVGVEGPELE